MSETQENYNVKVIDKRIQPESEIVPADSNSLVMAAINRGLSPELIEKMMELAERNEANIARKAYHTAMAKFKANPPKVWRDLQVKYEGKKTTWSHADLGVASDAIDKGLAEWGLNKTWRTEQPDGKIKVSCIITHEFGHSEETYLVAEADKTGSKNDIQAIGSTVFYLERYTLFAITGLAPARMDDDGKASGEPVSFISEAQKKIILDLIREKEADPEKFLAYMKIETLDEMPATSFSVAMSALKAKKTPERVPEQEG